jgi:hypothetical protein
MRASFPQTLRERRRSRASHEPQARAQAPVVQVVQRTEDPAVQRVRSAGGPIDQACYACACGFQFLAPVSTTVVCPHCQAPQAW